MVKATYLTASKWEKVALLIILFQPLMWSHNAATISSFHFYGLITYSLIFQPTVRDFSAWHKSILCIFLISCHSYSLQSCHQLMLDSGASNCIQTPPSLSWCWQYLHGLLTFYFKWNILLVPLKKIWRSAFSFNCIYRHFYPLLVHLILAYSLKLSSIVE